MPYIDADAKDELANTRGPGSAGELNYMFTQIALDYIKRQGEKYQHYNDIIGALEACKLEFYRRAVEPYEDAKIQSNGDVYT